MALVCLQSRLLLDFQHDVFDACTDLVLAVCLASGVSVGSLSGLCGCPLAIVPLGFLWGSLWILAVLFGVLST